MAKTDQQLIQLTLNGQREAYGCLVKRYIGHIKLMTSHIVQDPETANDIVQTAFISAYKKLYQYDNTRSSFETWLQRIAYHEALHRLKQQPNHLYIEEHETLALSIHDEAIDELLNDTNEERLRLLEGAIKRLRPEEQMLLHLYYMEERSLRDISYILSIQPNPIASRLKRIRKKLYIIIKKMEHGRQY